MIFKGFGGKLKIWYQLKSFLLLSMLFPPEKKFPPIQWGLKFLIIFTEISILDYILLNYFSSFQILIWFRLRWLSRTRAGQCISKKSTRKSLLFLLSVLFFLLSFASRFIFLSSFTYSSGFRFIFLPSFA